MNNLHPILKVLLGTLLLCVVGPLSLTMTNYTPITLQSLVLILVPVIIGWPGVLSVFFYLLIGAAGLPVFANFSGGVDVFISSTAGYLYGFVPAAALAAWWGQRLKTGYGWRFLLFMVCHLVLLIFGLGWQMANGAVISEVWGTAKFLFPGMFLKSFAGAILAMAIKK